MLWLFYLNPLNTLLYFHELINASSPQKRTGHNKRLFFQILILFYAHSSYLIHFFGTDFLNIFEFISKKETLLWILIKSPLNILTHQGRFGPPFKKVIHKIQNQLCVSDYIILHWYLKRVSRRKMVHVNYILLPKSSAFNEIK